MPWRKLHHTCSTHKHLIADKASIALWTSCHGSYTCKWRLAHMVSQESVLGGSISMERALDSSVGQMLGLRPRPPATKRHIDKHMANKHDCRMKHEELRKPINEFCNAFFDVNELNAPLAPGRPTPYHPSPIRPATGATLIRKGRRGSPPPERPTPDSEDSKRPTRKAAARSHAPGRPRTRGPGIPGAPHTTGFNGFNNS